MSLLKKIFLTLLLIFLILPPFIWTGGLLWFRAQISATPHKGFTTTEAIIVLTGGSDRINEGVRLLNKKHSNILFVSGVGTKGVTIEDMLSHNGFESTLANLLADNIEFGFEAKDTKGNARETAKWTKEKNINSIRLVTSNYHMPRSMLEFRKLMPDYTIIPHPVTSKNVQLDEWWEIQKLPRPYNIGIQ